MGHTAEYLTAFREKAGKLLPDWMVKRIHEAAMPSSGGKARWRPLPVDNTGASVTATAKGDDLLSALAALLSQLGFDPGSADDLGERLNTGLLNVPNAPVALPDFPPTSATVLAPDGQAAPLPAPSPIAADPPAVHLPDPGVDNVTSDAPAGDPQDPDDQATDIPWDEDLEGEDRLQTSEAADIVLRALWRDYMANHYPPTADQSGTAPNMVDFAADELVKKVHFWKADDEAQQIVYGVVLIPEQVDSQGDIVGADEIEAAAHQFLTQYRQSGIQHVGDALPSLEVIESYIAPVDMEVAGQQVPQGAWIIAVKINDPEIWQMVLDGRLTGFSIQGYANSEAEEAA
jgi:hypothetical protein